MSKFDLLSFFFYPEPWFNPSLDEKRSKQDFAFLLIQEDIFTRVLDGMSKVCSIVPISTPSKSHSQAA